MNHYLRIVARVLLGGLVIFELLNEFKVLHFTLDFTWIGLTLTSIFVWVVIEIGSHLLKKSCGEPLHGGVMMLAIVSIYIDALGDILHLYDRIDHYDQIAHFTAGMVTCALIFFVIWNLCRCEKIRLGLLGMGFISVTITAFLGTLYEIEEYSEDYFSGISRRLGDGPDTANDLLLDNLGAVIIAILIILVICIHAWYKKTQAGKIYEKASNLYRY